MPDTDDIKVASLTTNLDHDDGRRIYDAVQQALSAGRNVRLDFGGVDIVTPSLLNTSFRVLAKEYSNDFLKSRLQIVNSNRLINDMIRDALKPSGSDMTAKKAQEAEKAKGLAAQLKERTAKPGPDRDRER
jgi:hypothetical protein